MNGDKEIFQYPSGMEPLDLLITCSKPTKINKVLLTFTTYRIGVGNNNVTSRRYSDFLALKNIL